MELNGKQYHYRPGSRPLGGDGTTWQELIQAHVLDVAIEFRSNNCRAMGDRVLEIIHHCEKDVPAPVKAAIAEFIEQRHGSWNGGKGTLLGMLRKFIKK